MNDDTKERYSRAPWGGPLAAKCGSKSKGGSYRCTKAKGHVSGGDKRHSDGKYSWGGYS